MFGFAAVPTRPLILVNISLNQFEDNRNESHYQDWNDTFFFLFFFLLLLFCVYYFFKKKRKTSFKEALFWIQMRSFEINYDF